MFQVHCPDDYRQWLVSMFNLFGTKFVKLYSGPMWRVETTSQEEQTPLSSSKNPIEVCVFLTLFGERERAYLVVQLARFFAIYIYIWSGAAHTVYF